MSEMRPKLLVKLQEAGTAARNQVAYEDRVQTHHIIQLAKAFVVRLCSLCAVSTVTRDRYFSIFLLY